MLSSVMTTVIPHSIASQLISRSRSVHFSTVISLSASHSWRLCDLRAPDFLTFVAACSLCLTMKLAVSTFDCVPCCTSGDVSLQHNTSRLRVVSVHSKQQDSGAVRQTLSCLTFKIGLRHSPLLSAWHRATRVKHAVSSGLLRSGCRLDFSFPLALASSPSEVVQSSRPMTPGPLAG